MTIENNARLGSGGLWLTSLFLTTIFLGDVWLWKITLPLSMFVVPFFLLNRKQASLRIPPAAIPLLFLGVIIVVQFSLYLENSAFKWKSDLAVWLPVVFAGTTIIALRNAAMHDRSALRALVLGGSLTAAVMVIMIAAAPVNTYIVPGQSAHRVEMVYAAEKKQAVAVAPVAVAPVPVVAPASRESFAPEMTESDVAFYDLKNRAKNALGLSNYIAVFLVLVFAATLFCGAPVIAIVFGMLTALTLSRFGFVFMVGIVGVYVIQWKIGAVRSSIVVAFLGVAGLIGLYFLYGALPHLPGISSLTARFEYWQSGFDAVALHPIFGAPRSVLLDDLSNSITWSPHNSLLWVAANFGLLGLVAYCAYVWIVMREIAIAGASSRLWTGIFVGTAMVLVWSLVEIIALTPAFEILFAALYALALGKNTSGSRLT